MLPLYGMGVSRYAEKCRMTLNHWPFTIRKNFLLSALEDLCALSFLLLLASTANCAGQSKAALEPAAQEQNKNVPNLSREVRHQIAELPFYSAFDFIAFTINGKAVSVEAEPDTPLLWVVREQLKLTGTKFGCGIAQCGACTVHLDDQPARSCSIQISDVAGKSVTTIEGLSPDASHPLQKAWIAEQVPQCGYCQSGQIMQAAALLAQNPKPTRDEIVAHMDGNICRCGTYSHIIAAIQSVGRA